MNNMLPISISTIFEKENRNAEQKGVYSDYGVTSIIQHDHGRMPTSACPASNRGPCSCPASNRGPWQLPRQQPRHRQLPRQQPNRFCGSFTPLLIRTGPPCWAVGMSAGSTRCGGQPPCTLMPMAKSIPWFSANGPSNDDFTKWTFKIDPKAVFSDGSPITAEDVKGTWDLSAHPATGHARVDLFLSGVEGFAAVVQGRSRGYDRPGSQQMHRPWMLP